MNELLQRYHSGLSKNLKDQAREAALLRFLAQEYKFPSSETFSIFLRSDRFAPNHVVTIRSDVDGWGRDIYGVYDEGHWKFFIPKDAYSRGYRFKFLLDGSSWMSGADFIRTGPVSEIFTEDLVRFDHVDKRYNHPFERLRVSEDPAQQTLVQNCHDELWEFDVIVIGSGMGGGILADALTDRPVGVDTLVLDAGCLDFQTHIYNLPGDDLGQIVTRHQVGHWSAEPGVKMGFSLEVAMNLGGRSVFWSGVIPRMRDWELSHWPTAVADYLKNQGGYDAAEKLMRKHVTFGRFQEDLLTAARNRFEDDWEIIDTPRAFHQPEFPDKGNPPGSFIVQSTGTFSTAELLLDSLSTHSKGGTDHLCVNLNHLVTSLRREGNRIVEVICQDLVGNCQRRYRARQFVLAAGSMESTRIALASGFGKDHPLVGVGFTDHPSYFVGYDGKDIFIPKGSPYEGPKNHARIFLYPKKAYMGVWFNVEIVLNGRYWRERHADNDIQNDHLDSNPNTTVNLKFNFDYPLNDHNHIQLGGLRGKLNVRVEPVPFRQDWYNAVRDLTLKLLDFFGVGNLDFDKFVGFGDGGTPHHAGGTLRMGDSGMPNRCVVDSDLKFLNIDNLHVCDVSVFPHIPAANPSLTLGALALRLSDHLAVKVGK